MNRKSLFLLILCVIAVIVTYRLVGWDFNWSLFFSSLWSGKPGWLAASVVATLATYVIRAFRWQVLLEPTKHIPAARLLTTTLVGFSAIYVLGRAGELVRPLWLTRSEHIPLSASVATIIVERFLDTLMLIALFAWALSTVEVSAESGATLTLMKDTGWILVAGSAAAILLLFAFRSNTERIVRYIPFPRIASLLQNFAQGLGFLQSRSGLAKTLLHSVLLWIVIALQFWFILRGMNFYFSAEAATLVMVGTAIASIAQVPGIGGGFQAGFVFCMGTFFLVPAEQAIAASLIAWVFSYAPTVAVAVLYMAAQGITLQDLKATIRGPESQIP